MLKHLFKLMWNKKKQNLLLMTEILVSFLVMFAIFTLMVFYTANYRTPMGFEYEHVWAVSYSDNPATSDDSLLLFQQTLKQSLKSLPEVKEVSFSGHNFPFAMSSYQSGIQNEGKNVRSVNWYFVEDSYNKVLDIRTREGRWFNSGDGEGKITSVVINQTLREKLFGNRKVIGQVIAGNSENDTKMRVIGVIDDIKDKGDYQAVESSMYWKIANSERKNMRVMLVRIAPGASAAFESKLYKVVANILKDSSVEIEHLDQKLKTKNNLTLVPMIILLVVAGFLVINVALGLFGVLWYNISKRRGEIGIRRAIGASAASISLQLVGEALVLATMALLVGSFFAVQFPLLGVFDLPAGIYLVALGLSITFIYLLVILCAAYPGRQAAAIYPAVALHEE